MTRRRFRGRATKPSSRISRATRLVLVGSPRACSSCSTRGAPYVSPLSAKAIRMCAINTSSITARQLRGRFR